MSKRHQISAFSRQLQKLMHWKCHKVAGTKMHKCLVGLLKTFISLINFFFWIRSEIPDEEQFISIYGKIITNSFSLRTDRFYLKINFIILEYSRIISKKDMSFEYRFSKFLEWDFLCLGFVIILKMILLVKFIIFRLINPEAFGTGVYLMPSIIDHSCTPNCTVVFR